MKTKVLMTASAVFLAILGAGATFLPAEILVTIGAVPNPPILLIVQIMGALYLGFAMLNWTTRANLIGGIYSRPVAMANFLQFMIVSIALVRSLVTPELRLEILVGSIIYTVFAIWFGVVLFTHPGRPVQSTTTPS